MDLDDQGHQVSNLSETFIINIWFKFQIIQKLSHSHEITQTMQMETKNNMSSPVVGGGVGHNT